MVSVEAVEFGSVRVRSASFAETNVVKKFVPPLNCKLPLLDTVKNVFPDLEAVKISPFPLLSTVRAANDD